MFRQEGRGADMKSSIAIGATVLLAGLALPSAAQQDPFRLKAGARGEACLACHGDFEAVTRRAHVHTPVKAGQCTDCHNPHASAHGKLLAAGPNQVCTTCHSGMAPAGAKSVHASVEAGECATCHDPHASDFRNVLVASGNDLCATCHQEVASAAAAAAFKHDPATKDCATCHDPHASTAATGLLRKAEPELCLDCHRTDTPGFARKHQSYPVERAQCTSCHDPHGSANDGILWANVHAPVSAEMCGECHAPASSPRALEARKPALELCADCHAGAVEAAMGSVRLHWPVAEGPACLNCHNPHASDQQGLLARPEGALCGSCHQDTVARQARSATKHPPIEDGSCGACHAPHASNGTFLLAASNEIDLCATCHDWQRHSSHPIGENVVDPRNPNLRLTCASCHRSHGSPHKALSLWDPKMELCVQCHTQFGR
jgi:predicted CXXCH cytochrome family protein